MLWTDVRVRAQHLLILHVIVPPVVTVQQLSCAGDWLYSCVVAAAGTILPVAGRLQGWRLLL